MSKVINFILNEVPMEVKGDMRRAARFMQVNTPRIINLFEDKNDLVLKGTLEETIAFYVTHPKLKLAYDNAFTHMLLAHMTLYFNSQLLSKGQKLPLESYFGYLLHNQTYGLSREILNQYL